MSSKRRGTRIDAWLPDDLAEALSDSARASERSISGELRFAVRAHLKNSEAAPVRDGSATRGGARDACASG